MWIVRLALRRPYTFVVMSILILILGGLAIVRTPTDIFPNIDIPVVSIIWNYNGLVPQEMSDRIVTTTERNLTTTVDNIEHIESQSLYGIAVVKVFLQPSANIQQGIAQVPICLSVKRRQAARENVLHFPILLFADPDFEARFASDGCLCRLHVGCASWYDRKRARRSPINRQVN